MSQYVFIDLEYNSIKYGETAFIRSIHSGKILKNEIMQICASSTNFIGDYLWRLDFFVRPYYTKDINRYVSKITGITKDYLDTNGFTLRKALTLFGKSVSGVRDEVIFVSWSMSDRQVLIENYLAAGMVFPYTQNKWIDLQKVFADTHNLIDNYGHLKQISLTHACEMCDINIDEETTHDAKWDVIKTIEIFNKIGAGKVLKYNA